jgi:hypothetical protein
MKSHEFSCQFIFSEALLKFRDLYTNFDFFLRAFMLLYKDFIWTEHDLFNYKNTRDLPGSCGVLLYWGDFVSCFVGVWGESDPFLWDFY